MRKLNFSFKSLLVAAGLLVGSANAWAADEYSDVYTKTLTGATAWTSDDLTAWGVAENNKFSVSEASGLTLTVNGSNHSASYTVSFIATTSKIKYVVAWNVGNLVANNTGNTTNNTYLIFGDKLRLSFDRGYKVYWSTDGTFIRDGSHRVSDNNANDKTVTVTLIYDPISRTVESFTTSGINSYANDLTSKVRSAFAGEDIDMREVTFGYYCTGNYNDITTSIKSITASECTQEVSGHRYTINAVDGSDNVIKTLKSEYAENGDAVSVSSLNLVINQGGKFYELDDANVTNYSKAFTMIDEEATFKVNYKESSDIVYFMEAESFAGSNSSKADVRASGGAYTDYFRNNTSNDVTSLNKGVYSIETYIWDRTGQTINLYKTSKDNANILAGLTGSGAQSKIFLVDADNTATVLGCANNSCCFDYLIIRKIGDYTVELTSSANLQGYKTFYNATTNYEVDANTTIYKAAATVGAVTLTAVVGNIIPKNTPVILHTTDAGHSLTLTATASEPASGAYDGNELLVSAAGGETGTYILAYTTAKGLGFYQYSSALDADDIYLAIPADIPADVKVFAIVVDGEATGINSVQGEEFMVNDVLYNLNGQVVTKDYKGIVIKNGKKYIQK